MAEQLSISINLNGTEQVVSSIGQVKKALKEAEFQALALEEQFGAGSPQVIALRKNIEGLRDKIGDAADATKTFAEGGLFTTAGKALAGVAGGFSAIQGAIGLVGVESKDLEKTLLKVQSAMALSQGIESVIQAKDSFVNLANKVKDSSAFIKANELATKAAAFTTRLFGGAVDTTSKSFKVLKGAIAATGIGLLVVAIGELVSAFQEYQGAAEKAKKKQEELNDSIKKGAKVALDAETAFLENSQKLEVAKAKSIGASEEEIYNIEQKYKSLKIESTKRYNKEVQGINAEADVENKINLNKQETDLQVSTLEFQGNQLKSQSENNKEVLAKQKEANDKYNELMQNRASKESDAQQQIISSYRATLPEKEKEILNAEDELEKKKEVLIKAGYTNFEQLEAEHKVVIAGITKKYDDIDTEENKKKTDKKLEIEKNAIDRSIELQTLNAETVKEKRDAEILALEEDYRVKIELAKKNGEDTAILEQIKTAKITDINDKAVKDQIAIDKVAKDAKIKNLDDIANLLGGFSALFGQQTAASKAFTLAQLGIDTASAISSLTRNSEANPANAATFGVAGTIQFATGLLRILTNVKKAKDLLSSPKSSVSMSSPSASAKTIAPIQPQAQQAQLTQLNQSSINAIGNQSMRAYVVETDVTSSQQRIAAIQQRARFN